MYRFVTTTATTVTAVRAFCVNGYSVVCKKGYGRE